MTSAAGPQGDPNGGSKGSRRGRGSGDAAFTSWSCCTLLKVGHCWSLLVEHILVSLSRTSMTLGDYLEIGWCVFAQEKGDNGCCNNSKMVSQGNAAKDPR